ncbi:MAG: hypothetical protein L0K86_00170 [Actinomycetia bacterium]|nr:hypothetical protein [Actinomycetes bacterium]
MAERSRTAQVAEKVRRNLYWGRTHGWANLLEEHDLDPRVRIPRAVRDLRWSLHHRVLPGSARALFLVGAQRSGTNMIAHGLDQAPEVAVYNEGDRRAFAEFQLRDLAVVDTLIYRSRRPFVLFKPLCDSDRTAELLDRDRSGPAARAIWAFRDVEGRVRSHVLKFGTSNLDAFRNFVRDAGNVSWQLRGVSAEHRDLVHSLDVERMSPESASALFWFIRNSAFFEGGLHRRPDVMLADYGAFLADPSTAMSRLCAFIGFPYRADLVSHVAPQRRTPRAPVMIDDRIRELCLPLEERLRSTYHAQAAQVVIGCNLQPGPDAQ